MHLDLRNVGLTEAGIKFISSFLNKAQALQCLHLGGNEGVTQEVINWVCERIKGRMKGPEINVPPLSKEFQYKQFDFMGEKAKPIKKNGLLKLLRRATSVE